MTSKAQNQGKNQDVSSGIHRAAERIGHTGDELKALRRIAKVAEGIFEHHGEGDAAVAVLREALRSAGDDFGVIGDAHGAGQGVPEMFYVRAKARTELALELAGYRLEFDPRESAGES